MGDRQLFIGNLCNITIESLRAYCEKYGTITDLSLNRDKDNNIYHCFAFVSFQSSRSITQFMKKRPHLINNSQIFVKRALSRITASIPERLVVTNRLVVPNSIKYNKQILKNYLQNFGQIKKFDYENGFIDFDDYDIVDRILITRPHHIQDQELFTINDDDDDDENFKIKYQILEKEFDEYKQFKEKELKCLKKELEQTKEELSDITQIKLDKLIKNQQLFHNQLLFRLYPECDSIHAQMCEDFLRSTPKKKRKSTAITLTETE